ncbi:hypothetical protein [Tardiphaga robiniae]|uniref:hypothetical protein n=1 Tax=Tardiphaga robiniae TaxID=943830 RepID=UPI0015861314|nr:hypothetical protein [Tardiphaga robiniae]NUU41856.1 hypothetical protein [Tardiphaga robiniae]
MRYREIENIWTVDVSALSNADRGRVFYERAKQIAEEALTDPTARSVAVVGSRLRRKYLASKIGSGTSVMNQNPRIKRLLASIDEDLLSEAQRGGPEDDGVNSGEDFKVSELVGRLRDLREKLRLKTAEVSKLRRQVRQHSLKS